MTQNEWIQFYGLITAAVEGTIRPEEFARLKEILQKEPAAIERYAEYMVILTHLRTFQTADEHDIPEDSGLNMELWQALAYSEKTAETIELPKLTESKADSEKADRSRPAPRTSKMSVYALILSSAALIFLLAYAYLFTGVSRPIAAHLTKTVDARWQETSSALNWGSDLRVGELHLRSGCAELLFEGGTVLVIEGPSHLVLESGSQIFLQEGKVVAKMAASSPDGFVVRSPAASVVDYGTEFGVSVLPTGMTETYVYEGLVEIRDSSNPLRFRQRRLLNAGQGVQADTARRIMDKKIDPFSFVRSEEMDVRFQAQNDTGYYRWKSYSYTLRRDPFLMVYCPFEKDLEKPDVLLNAVSERSGVPDGLLGDGFAAKPQWVKGRWPQKTALAFDRARRQGIRIPYHPAFCISNGITVAVWVNLSPHPEALGGHILSCRDGNHVNYQLSYFNGWAAAGQEAYTIQFLRYQNFTKTNSPPIVLEPSRWYFLAVTHDGNLLSFYVDGRLVGTVPYAYHAEPAAADLLIGDVEVPGTDYSFKRFHGVLDEAAVFNRVLSPEELRCYYEAGKPQGN